MGKAHITGGGAAGLYQIEIVRDLKRVQKRIADLGAEIVHLNAALDQQSDMLTIAFAQQLLAKDAADAAWAVLDAIPPDNAADRRAALTAVDKAMGEWRKKQIVEEEVRLELSRLRLARDAAVKERDRLAKIPERITTPAWCADFTEDLTGDVGTIEPPDERTGPVIIRPGYPDRAAYAGDRDGVLMPVDAQTPAQWLFNLMLLPSVQKWRPQHRVGIIRTLDGDTCSLDLVPANSSADQVDVNAKSSLDAVPITYMDCHGGAFDVGDRVVVAFTLPDIAAPYAAYLEATRTGDAAATQASRAQVLAAVQDPMREPRVIGFESNPRPCGRVFTVEWGWTYAPAQISLGSEGMATTGKGSRTVTATRLDGSQFPVEFHYDIHELRGPGSGSIRQRCWITLGVSRTIELYSLDIDMGGGSKVSTTRIRRLGWVCTSGAYGAVEGESTYTVTSDGETATITSDTAVSYVEHASTSHVRYTTSNAYSETIDGDGGAGTLTAAQETIMVPFLELTEVSAGASEPCKEQWLDEHAGSYSTTTVGHQYGSNFIETTHVVRGATYEIPIGINIPMEWHVADGSYPDAHSFLELGFWEWDTAFPWE